MHPIAEGEAEREMLVLGQVDLSGERDIAVGGRGELPIQLEILIQILPSVAPSDITARTPHKPYVGSQSQPGIVLVRGQKLVTGHPRQIGIIPPSADVQMRREQDEQAEA